MHGRKPQLRPGYIRSRTSIMARKKHMYAARLYFSRCALGMNMHVEVQKGTIGEMGYRYLFLLPVPQTLYIRKTCVSGVPTKIPDPSRAPSLFYPHIPATNDAVLLFTFFLRYRCNPNRLTVTVLTIICTSTYIMFGAIQCAVTRSGELRAHLVPDCYARFPRHSFFCRRPWEDCRWKIGHCVASRRPCWTCPRGCSAVARNLLRCAEGGGGWDVQSPYGS